MVPGAHRPRYWPGDRFPVPRLRRADARARPHRPTARVVLGRLPVAGRSPPPPGARDPGRPRPSQRRPRRLAGGAFVVSEPGKVGSPDVRLL